jgi:hypothetical protein
MLTLAGNGTGVYEIAVIAILQFSPKSDVP